MGPSRRTIRPATSPNAQQTEAMEAMAIYMLGRTAQGRIAATPRMRADGDLQYICVYKICIYIKAIDAKGASSDVCVNTPGTRQSKCHEKA